MQPRLYAGVSSNPPLFCHWHILADEVNLISVLSASMLKRDIMSLYKRYLVVLSRR